MEAHRTEAIVQKDGSVTVRGVPFHEGERVDVIVLPREQPVVREDRYPLRGSVVRFDQPLDPAAEPGEWEAEGGST